MSFWSPMLNQLETFAQLTFKIAGRISSEYKPGTREQDCAHTLYRVTADLNVTISACPSKPQAGALTSGAKLFDSSCL